MRLTTCIAIFFALCAMHGCTPDRSSELQRLQGTWVNTPPKQGRGTEYTLHFFNDGTLGWDRFQTIDGEAVAGTKKGYKVELNPTATPKEITLSRGEGNDREVLLGIYERDGDTLKLRWMPSKDRPKNFNDGGLILKKAK